MAKYRMYKNNNVMNTAGDPQLIPFWWYKLNTDPSYTAALKARWAQYRRNNLREDRIMATIDSLATVLNSRGAVRRNYQAWPRWGQYVWPNYYVATGFADEVAWLKQWLTDRIAWMDEQLGFDPNERLRGDVDGDGSVTIKDLTALIDRILAYDYDLTGDCNLDGSVTVADVTCLVDYILSGNWQE